MKRFFRIALIISLTCFLCNKLLAEEVYTFYPSVGMYLDYRTEDENRTFSVDEINKLYAKQVKTLDNLLVDEIDYQSLTDFIDLMDEEPSDDARRFLKLAANLAAKYGWCIGCKLDEKDGIEFSFTLMRVSSESEEVQLCGWSFYK